MAAIFEQWTSSSKDAIALTLTRSNEPISEPFSPVYTHFVYGEEQVIVGYKKPRIDISFRSHDLKPSVNISSAHKIKVDISQKEQLDKLMDLEGPLKPFLPAEAFEEDVAMDGDESSWTPPGQKLHNYRYDGEEYEIWQSTLDDDKTYTMMDNIKILIPFFIETGTVDFMKKPEESEELHERWSVFFLYHVEKNVDSGSRYGLAGFSTAYRFYALFNPDGPRPGKHDALELPCRQRISQFLILPPHQGKSHGIQLYNTMCDSFRRDPSVFEITVEDPNEAFDSLRDYCDLAKLHIDPLFSSLKPNNSSLDKSVLAPGKPVPIDALLPSDVIPALRKTTRLFKRQVMRLVELHLLNQIPSSHRSAARLMRKALPNANPQDRAYYLWRLLVKVRVARRNWDSLEQIDDREERVAKVVQSADSIKEGYEILLEGYQRRIDEGLLPDPYATATGAEADRKGKGVKRKIVLDDSDEDGAPSKKSAMGDSD
jgi:histone acetyltransferase 1